MKTIKQQAEVSFNSLDFSDKVMLLPIMNMLAESVKENESTEITITVGSTWHLEPKYAKKALKVLSDLGCRTPLGESYEDIVKSNNSQNEKQKHHILHLFDAGQNRIETIKRIKTQLNLSAEDARKLVDSCPVNIDLHKYKIERPNYEILFNSLKQIGCICNLTIKEQ